MWNNGAAGASVPGIPSRAMDNKRLMRRFIRSRPHLSLAIALGVVVALLMPTTYRPLERVLIGWNAAVWPYLVAMLWLIATCDSPKVRMIASRQDEGAGLVLSTLTLGTLLCLAAMVSELRHMGNLPAEQLALRYAFTALTLLGCWSLVAVLFCFHYAHQFYGASARTAPLHFPDGQEEPNYWDFLYFSFTIAVSVGTSDVDVMTRAMRKLVLIHSVLSFLFNLLILGLWVNLAAGLVNS
jgi:uncharacterized membrane protein